MRQLARIVVGSRTAAESQSTSLCAAAAMTTTDSQATSGSNACGIRHEPYSVSPDSKRHEMRYKKKAKIRHDAAGPREAVASGGPDIRSGVSELAIWRIS